MGHGSRAQWVTLSDPFPALHCGNINHGSYSGPRFLQFACLRVYLSIFLGCVYDCSDDAQLYTVINPSSSTDLQKLYDCVNAVTNWYLFNGVLNPKTEALDTGTR